MHPDLLKRIPYEDFRSSRKIFSKDTFFEPTDIIEESIWHNIITAGTHAAIKTSNHHGSCLKRMYDLKIQWRMLISGGIKRPFIDLNMVCPWFNGISYNPINVFSSENESNKSKIKRKKLVL